MWFMDTVFDNVYTRYYQLVLRLATGWTVQGWNPGVGEISCTRPVRPWGPPSLLYSGYLVFPEDKAAGAWNWPPTPSSTEVKERVVLHFYSASGPSWPFFLGWNLPFPLPLLPIHDICIFSDITAMWVLFHQDTLSIGPLFYLANVVCHMLQIWSRTCSLVHLHFLSNSELLCVKTHTSDRKLSNIKPLHVSVHTRYRFIKRKHVHTRHSVFCTHELPTRILRCRHTRWRRVWESPGMIMTLGNGTRRLCHNQNPYFAPAITASCKMMHSCSLLVELVGPVPRRNQECRQNQSDNFVSCCTKWRCLLTSNEMWEHLHHLVHQGRYIQGFGGESWGKETSWKNRRRWEIKIKLDIE